MHTKNIRIFPVGLLGIWLWLVPVAPLAFTACDAEPVKVSVTMEADYSQIIEAINSASQTLTTKMALIESALSQGFADDKAAQDLLRQAVSSLSGTTAEKLAAVETAVKSGTTSLELKLGLIEAAVTGGFADENAQQALVRTAIASLSGTLAEKLAAVETAVGSQTTSLATKLGLIETALTEGLADEKAGQALLQQAVEALSGTAAERLLAIEQAVDNQASSLATKLGLIDAALEKGLADNEESLLLIGNAVASLDSTMEDKLPALEAAVKSGTLGLATKLGLIETAVAGGFADRAAQEELLLKALQTLGGTMEAKLAAVTSAIGNQRTALSTQLELIDAAIRDGILDQKAAQGLIQDAVAALSANAADKLAAIDTAVCSQTLALWIKLELIESAVTSGLASEATALGEIGQALTHLMLPGGQVDGIVNQIRMMDTTLNQKVAGLLSDIFTGVDTLSEYRPILIAIKRALYDLTDHSINGHEYIEMGPGRKWATMNVGATLPEEKGDYYAWGNVETHYKSLNPLVWKTGRSGGYVGENYKFVEQGGSHNDRRPEDRITKYTLEDQDYNSWWYNWGDKDRFRGDRASELGDPQYNYADDVARQDWGATWRIPTKADWEWLIENCTWEWTDDYKGKRGMLITSYIPGFEFNQIFLPGAMRIEGTKYYPSYDSGVAFWSSTLKRTSEAYSMQASLSECRIYPESRFFGLPVRPVSN